MINDQLVFWVLIKKNFIPIAEQTEISTNIPNFNIYYILKCLIYNNNCQAKKNKRPSSFIIKLGEFLPTTPIAFNFIFFCSTCCIFFRFMIFRVFKDVGMFRYEDKKTNVITYSVLVCVLRPCKTWLNRYCIS